MMRRREVLPDLARAGAAIDAEGIPLGRPLTLVYETTSTNDLAKAAARSGAPHGATFVAETQSAGRGRQGRRWLDAPGEALLFSVLLRVACPLARLPQLALVSGLAVKDAVARFVPAAATPQLKWPNDVLLGGKKVAGILVESLVAPGAEGETPALVVGVGLNVTTRSFPEPIAAIATSVALWAESPPDRAALLASLLANLHRDVELVAAHGLGLVHARLTAADALRDRPVRSDDGEGVARGIDRDGRLVVETKSGAMAHWSSGEVHIVAP